MSIELSTFNSLPLGTQYDVAKLVSEYTNGNLDEKPQMLPVEPETVFNKHMGVVAMRDGDFAGYVGATNPVEHDGTIMPEVGSLWVPREHRKQGIANHLVTVITNELVAAGEVPYAFCNPLSEHIFTLAGFSEAPVAEIPAIAFGSCASCPMLPVTGGCCDKPLKYQG